MKFLNNLIRLRHRSNVLSILLTISCVCDIFVESGRPTDERLQMRLRDLELSLSNDSPVAEDDNDDRQRRQLPTEINIQVTAPLFTARLYDHGPNEGDKEVPSSIDVGIKFELQHPLTLFGEKHTDVFVLSNGAIGFEPNSRNYKSDVFHGGPMLIAPLWNRNDLRKGGKIYFREVTEGRVVERAQSEVRYQYDKIIKPTSVLLVTWTHMQPMGEQNLGDENSNTFQAAIISSDNGTFANFIYKSIGWTQGAEAGFSKGDSKNFHALPTSGTSNIMYLKEYGNTGIPGEWMFEIDTPKIIRCKPGIKGDTCDDECAEFEWGNDCEKCCHCGKGRCNVISGECGGGECKQCWNNPPYCDKRQGDCKARTKDCGYNAISFTDFDRCGEPIVRCQCLSGYTGDGFNCTDVDECTKANTCGTNANCYNTPGRFYCECQSGYKGNGTICVPTTESSGGIQFNAPGGVNRTTAASSVLLSAVTQETVAQTSHAPITTSTPESTSAAPTSTSTVKSTTPAEETTPTTTPTPSSQALSTASTTSSPASTGSAAFSAVTNASTTASSLVLEIETTHLPATSTLPPPSRIPTKLTYPDAVQTLPKETYSQIMYRLRQPLNVFGKQRDHLTISSTGLIALDDVPTVTPDDDLDELGITGFAPFFGKIDLGQRVGSVNVRETSHSDVLTEATSLIDNYFHAPGFMAKSVLTITFENVSTVGAAQLKSNSFQVMLIGGNNALGENVTYVEYVYSNLQWTDGAQAVILADNAASTVQLPGSGSDGVRQLSQLSNIDEPGQWMYRVDLERVTCPQSNLLPPYCNSDVPAPTESATHSTPSNSIITSGFKNSSIIISSEAGIVTISNGTAGVTEPPEVLTDFEEETVTFPPFVTVVPLLITPATSNALTPRAPGAVNHSLPVAVPPHTTLRPTAVTLLATRPGSLPVVETAVPATSVGITHVPPPRPPSANATAPSPLPVPQSPEIPPLATDTPTDAVPENPLDTTIEIPFDLTTENVPILAAATAPIPTANATSSVAPTGPPAESIANLPKLATEPIPVPEPSTVAFSAPPLITATPSVAFAADVLPNGTVNGTFLDLQQTVVPVIAAVTLPATVAPGAVAPTSNESQVPVADSTDSPANLPPLHIFTTPRRLTRPPVPTRPPPRIVTATTTNNEAPAGAGGGNRRPPPTLHGNEKFQNENEEADSLNSPSKLAIIIPTAIVGVWLLLLIIIGFVVCCRRRSGRRRMRSKYDPAYHFRHMPSIAAAPRSKEAAAVAAAAAAAASAVPTSSNNGYPQPHVTYEDHLEKAARLSEMSQYGQNGGRVSMYGSYWNVPNNNRQYSYYNQGYYESCPEFNRNSYYNGRY